MEKQQIIDAIKSFERPHEEFVLSVTFGHVLVNHQNLTAVSYDEEHGIADLLDYLARLGWTKIFDGDTCIGVEKDQVEVRLGIGGQINWTYHNFIHMNDLSQAYLGFVEGLFEELKRRNQLLLATGHQPVTKSADIKPIPSEEANMMLAYADGNEGLRDFLLGAATTSVSLQFAHSDNFQKRFQSALIIHPALAAFFDNVSWLDGKANDTVMVNVNNLRQAEDDLYHFEDGLAETFKYEEYADFVQNAPSIAVPEGDALQATGAQAVQDAYADKAFTKDDFLRTMRYLKPMIGFDQDGMTIANIDSVPFPLNMAYVLMIKALLYNPDHITALEKVLEDMKEEKLLDARQEVFVKGLEGKLGEGTVMDLIKDLFFMITLTVEPTEQHYLQPLNSLLFKDVKTKEVGARQFEAIVGE